MSKRINKSSLSMDSPRCFTILYIVKTAICTCLHGTCYECVRIIAEYIYPCRCNPKLCRALPSIPGWFTQEECCTSNLQTRDCPPVPQLAGTESLLIPIDGCRCIGDC